MLTDKEKRFCEEYLVDRNATQAAIRAGYAPTTAKGAAKWIQDKNPRKPILKKTIEELKQSQSIRTEITADRVLEAIAEIGFGEYQAKDRLKALELIGKHLGLFATGADNSAALEKLDEVLGKIEGGF